jgi:hypothetical protein
MIHLSAEQVQAITRAAWPLAPDERVGFMAAVFERLLFDRHEIGDGSLGRTLRELQARYFTPPSDFEAGLHPWRTETNPTKDARAKD